MKSCLKSPRLSPTHSAVSTPSGSGCASPGFASPGCASPGSASPSSADAELPCLRKQVSFCQKEDGLEEVFEADDWDRTPAPVAPKLSYQDLLELKQIMQSLPRVSCNASSRMPFTTSMPGACHSPASTSSTPPPFPISRLAASPSLIPSKWKNRDDSAAHVDPEILPYLDSVPIRLLPLLPPSEEPQSQSQNNTPSLPHASFKSANPSLAAADRAQAPVGPPITLQSSCKSSSPASSPSPTSSPSSPQQNPTPTHRRPNFSFVPLLPVHEEAKAHEEPEVRLLVHSAPQVKHFNMPFLPLLPPEEHSPAPSVVDEIASATPQNEAPSAEDVDEREASSSSYFPMGYAHAHAHAHSPTSTPSLSSASDTDTESEAPSVHSPAPSSPADDYDALAHYFAAHPPFPPHTGAEPLNHAHAHGGAGDSGEAHNPYFPPMPAHHDAALSNPPLPLPLSSAAAPAKKTRLQALPSPALAPPSPFSLYPCEDADVVDLSAGSNSKRAFAARPSGLSVSSTASSSSSSSSASSSSASSSVDSSNTSVADECEAPGRRIAMRTRAPEPGTGTTTAASGTTTAASGTTTAASGTTTAASGTTTAASGTTTAASSLSDTPELTIESMRAAYDKLVERAAEREERRSTGAGGVLGPSLSRIVRRE